LLGFVQTLLPSLLCCRDVNADRTREYRARAATHDNTAQLALDLMVAIDCVSVARAEAMLTLLLTVLVVVSEERHGPVLLTQPLPDQPAVVSASVGGGERAVAFEGVAPPIQPNAPCTLSNLVVTSTLRPVIELMWHTSPTFKAQCARLRQTPGLFVSIFLGNQSQVGARGRVVFVRAQGDLVRAEVLICHDFRSTTELVEVLAHELEHVIEQLDGVQLTSDSTHGVHRTASGAFETARARHIGQKVSGEVDAARESAGKSGPR